MIEPKKELEARDVFTEGEMKLVENFLQVVDKSPILDPKAEGHNEDFFSVQSGIEITREGMLKIRKLASYSSEIRDVKIVETKNDLHVTVIKKLWDEAGSIETVGGCSWSEVAPRKARYEYGPKKGELSDTRIFNDIVTRAETRADKRGVEMKVGIPFVNTVIKMLFGGFEVGSKKQTSMPAPQAQKAITAQSEATEGTITVLNDILVMLRKARDEKKFTPGEMGVRWNACQKVAGDKQALLDLRDKYQTEVEERKKP
jgi:hypothetical protein